MAGTAQTLASSGNDCGRAAFFAMLTRDDRGSAYHFMSRDASGLWSAEGGVPAAGLAAVGLVPGFDWYVTPNGFSTRSKYGRKVEKLRQVNVLKYDIDFHAPADDAPYLSYLAFEILKASWCSGAIPVPSMVVDSGRGLHLYYALERSTAYRLRGGAINDRGLRYLADVDRRLADALQAAIETLHEARLDRSVSDLARVMRVPGTINRANGRTCQVVYDSGTTHTLASLAAALPAQGRVHRPMRPRLLRFDKLSMSRMAKVEALQEARGTRCHGTRELMCFVYYNAAVQVYESRDDAFEALVAFNERFVERVAVRELEGVRRSVDKVGFYKIGAEKVTGKFLQMSAEEIEELGFFESVKKTSRAAAKRRTAERREARNALIAELYGQAGATYVSVAKQVGCSRRTVANVLKTLRDATSTTGSSSLKDAIRTALDQRTGAECKKLPHVFSCFVGEVPLDGAAVRRETWVFGLDGLARAPG